MKVKADTIARTAGLILALVNQILAVMGKEVLPFGDDEFYQAVSLLATFMTSVAAWWKNNSFTQAALEADSYKDQRKEKENEG